MFCDAMNLLLFYSNLNVIKRKPLVLLETLFKRIRLRCFIPLTTSKQETYRVFIQATCTHEGLAHEKGVKLI